MRQLSFPSFLLLFFLFCSFHGASAFERQKLNFNADWELHIGDLAAPPTAPEGGGAEVSWKSVTLPYAFNGDEAFRKDIVDLTDTVVWYRKTFDVSPRGDWEGAKFFIEFEGARQGADVWLNG